MNRKSLIMAVLAAAVVASVAAPAGATMTSAQKCTSAYLKAAANHMKCMFLARDKAQRHDTTADFTKCELGYADSKFTADSAFGSDCPLGLWNGGPQRFVDNGDTITDNATGLMWEKKDNLDGTKNPADPHDADNTYTWDDASANFIDQLKSRCADETTHCEDDTACTGIGTGLCGFAGHQDWRLPTVGELETILAEPFACTFGPPCVDKLFNNPPGSYTQQNFYWSGTKYPSSIPAAWVVLFKIGDVTHISTSGPVPFSYYVRAVRNVLGFK